MRPIKPQAHDCRFSTVGSKNPSLLARVADPYIVAVYGRPAHFRLVWIQRRGARDILIHCEDDDNLGVSACNAAGSVRQHLLELGLPPDALWLEVSSRRTELSRQLFAVLGRDYIAMPVKFTVGGPTWLSSVTLDDFGATHDLDGRWLKELCRVEPQVIAPQALNAQ